MEWLHSIIEIDRQLFLYLNGFYSDFRDTLMFFITRKESWLPLYLVIIFFIFKTYRAKGFAIVLILLAGIVVSDQVAGVVKEFVQRVRPVYEPAIEDMVHNFFRKGGKYGFYSAHASNSFLLLIFTSFIFKDRLYKYTMFVWALLICYSRIYLGEHYPLDILAGIAVGSLLGWMCFKLLMFFEHHFFIDWHPKIEKLTLSHRGSVIISLTLLVIISTMLILTRDLHYYHLL